MKQTLIAVAVSAATAAFSAPVTFLSSLNSMPPVHPSREAGKVCTDFSGNWKGTCTLAEGKKLDESFSMAQTGCEMLQVSGEKQNTQILPIGGVMTTGGAIPGNPAMTFGSSVDSSWNKEKTTLTISIMGGGKKLASDDAGQGFFLTEEARIVNGKLAVDIHAAGSSGEIVSFCEFDRQN